MQGEDLRWCRLCRWSWVQDGGRLNRLSWDVDDGGWTVMCARC